MSVSTAFFDQLYADNSDPWAFRERWYEQRKRAVTLASLPRQHYPAIFEIGCANGELSAGLAQRTGALLACDAAARAVDLARQRLSHCAHVQVHQSRVPEQWPEHRFDLIVISEVAYYLDPKALEELIQLANDNFRMHQLYAYVKTSNERSIKLFQCAGFDIVATLKDWIYEDGAYHNVYLLQKFL